MTKVLPNCYLEADSVIRDLWIGAVVRCEHCGRLNVHGGGPDPEDVLCEFCKAGPYRLVVHENNLDDLGLAKHGLSVRIAQRMGWSGDALTYTQVGGWAQDAKALQNIVSSCRGPAVWNMLCAVSRYLVQHDRLHELLGLPLPPKPRPFVAQFPWVWRLGHEVPEGVHLFTHDLAMTTRHLGRPDVPILEVPHLVKVSSSQPLKALEACIRVARS